LPVKAAPLDYFAASKHISRVELACASRCEGVHIVLMYAMTASMSSGESTSLNGCIGVVDRLTSTMPADPSRTAVLSAQSG